MALGRRRVTKVWKNESGNALPLMAAAIFPIIASIGAGVDIARAHMTEAKLQEAVDSAALAGRRAMSGNDIETAKPDANAYLGFNFPAGFNGTGPVATEITMPSAGTVRVSARTTMPTIFMKLFGYMDHDISVASEATQNFENIDIVLVLDTTGSMAGSRIEALRDAVREFYDELAPAQASLEEQGLRMRFGIVPYSSTVNVGRLLLERDRTYIQTNNVRYFHWRDNDSSNSRENWQFGQRTYNLTNYVLNNAELGNINGHSDGSRQRWAGCIEERQTVTTITANDPRKGPPSTALDLNIDLIPSDNASRWKPYVMDPKNALALNPRTGRLEQTFNPNQYCPAAARRLAVMSAADIEDALDDLVPDGNTFLDVGMVWGTRLISNNGVFGVWNPETHEERPVRKFIIFMTDGEMNTPRDYTCVMRDSRNRCIDHFDHSMAYSAWGIERFDQRVGGTTNNDNRERHMRRFLMACNEARARNVSVWTIAFAEGDTDELEQCASNPDQFSFAADREALIDRFKEIGRNIGPLRLSK